MICILKKTITKNHWNWHNALSNALWANKVILKEALWTSPYYLLYKKEEIIPPNIFLPSLQVSQASRGEPSSTLQNRIDMSIMLEEEKEKAKNNFSAHL